MERPEDLARSVVLDLYLKLRRDFPPGKIEERIRAVLQFALDRCGSLCAQGEMKYLDLERRAEASEGA